MPPPRKPPKEAVIYPASTRKVPAFKPLKPSKVPPRIPTTGSESSSVKKAKATATAKKKAAGLKKSTTGKRRVIEDGDEEEDDDDDEAGRPSKRTAMEENSDERARPRATTLKATKSAPRRRKSPAREGSPMSISSGYHRDDPPGSPLAVGASMPTQTDDGVPSIPQPLLVRLLHEGFVDTNTRIDTQAIQVLQTYVDVFVREAIARSQQVKQQAEERGEVEEIDAGWLEVEDLEKAAPALFLDF